MKTIVTLLVVMGALNGAPTALAADGGGKAPPQVVELETMVIEGKISKPQVYYVLGRSRISYKGIKLQRTFVDRIVASTQKNPF